MNTHSVTIDQVEFQDNAKATTASSGFSLLAGFIRHYQDAQRIQRETRKLYAMSDEARGYAREEVAAQLARLYRA